MDLHTGIVLGYDKSHSRLCVVRLSSGAFATEDIMTQDGWQTGAVIHDILLELESVYQAARSSELVIKKRAARVCALKKVNRDRD